MKMTTWTSEGEMKPRDVTLAEAFSIVFHDFICHGGRIYMTGQDGVHFKRPPNVLSLKESIFSGHKNEERLLYNFYSRYYDFIATYGRLLYSKSFSSDSPRYSDYLVVFGEPRNFSIPNDYDENIRVYRMRMANAALLNTFEIPLTDEPHIVFLLRLSFDVLYAFIMLAREASPDNFSQFVTENYQLCS